MPSPGPESPDLSAATVRIADLEPVASFIAAVKRHDARFYSLAPDEFEYVGEVMKTE